ncbi:MAG TPA: hypothetical protein VNZ64_09330 [Candidatus Acidoferrum sp.]|nr:hypothetical protein [Candidatus Acidoferrum sp.]
MRSLNHLLGKGLLGQICASLSLSGWFSSGLLAAQPLALHPENPHYFLFRGKPTVVITSGEHYGAVLNLDFDYVKYLNTLARDGLNGTRTWAGAYCEPPSAFNIASNTLAPRRGRFICPWARSNQPGYGNGGNKFDLNRWDAAYFKRLKDFMSRASRKGIVVELNLFCPFYEESMWQLSPMNAINNVNGIGTVTRTNVYTLDRNGGLLEVQEAMVRKLVTELEGFANFYYEICNEPYFGGVTIDWQRHIADVISETETGLGARHLISQNIANGKAWVENPHPAVSIFNFHYASPPDTVALNFGLNRVIGDNETGFRGTNDAPYRMEAWDFIVAGGGLFNHLDYSFTAGHEDGTFVYPASQPGGGNAVFRRQIRFLSECMKRFDFVHMRPENGAVHGELPPGATIRALVRPGQDYLIYLRTGAKRSKTEPAPKTDLGKGELAIEVTLPAGDFEVEWLDPKTPRLVEGSTLASKGGARQFSVPAFEEDVVLAIQRR